MKIEIEQELWNVECCSGTGHTIRDGGRCINVIVLNKKAFSRFLVAHYLWDDGKERPPRATAVMCDACVREKIEPVFAVGKDEDGGSIYRVPVCELGDWHEEEFIR